MKTTIHIATVVTLLILVSACQDTSPTQAPATAQQPVSVKPGENLSGLDDLRLIAGSGGDASEGDGIGAEYCICGLAFFADAVVIAEITGPPELVRLPDDCSGPWSWGHHRVPVKIIGNVAGEEVPYEMDIRFVGDPLPFERWNISTGDVLLTTVRGARDAWFGYQPMLVNFHRDGFDLSTNEVDVSKTDIPTTFNELHEELSRAMADMKGVCPDWPIESDEHFERRAFNPAASEECAASNQVLPPTLDEEPPSGDNECPPEGCRDE